MIQKIDGNVEMDKRREKKKTQPINQHAGQQKNTYIPITVYIRSSKAYKTTHLIIISNPIDFFLPLSISFEAHVDAFFLLLQMYSIFKAQTVSLNACVISFSRWLCLALASLLLALALFGSFLLFFNRFCSFSLYSLSLSVSHRINSKEITNAQHSAAHNSISSDAEGKKNTRFYFPTFHYLQPNAIWFGCRLFHVDH